jgi:NNP family nitrate/nitrite transporter-like MFS transporter
VPSGWLAAQSHDTQFWVLLACAATAGFGGGNFSSSMANISFFYPEGKKGLALGMNAAGGNLGVAITQLIVPIVITIGTGIHLAYAALIWMPFIVVATICAWFFMDSLTQAKPDGQSYKLALSNQHTWVMSFLYIGTFGSFIGFSFAFPSLIKISFVDYKGWVALAFLGALIGSVARPFGGWMADRIGGAKVTLGTFVGLGIGTIGVIVSVDSKNFALFFGSFIALFILAGVGNGSTYRMIPAIFRTQVDDDKSAKRQAAAVVGIAGAIGAAGGVLVNLVFKFSLEGSKTLTPALTAFLVFYGVCVATTWWFYLRRTVFAERPSLAYAGV